MDKPPGPTSHDVVARVRRAFGVKRVGHAGTLDPAATGLLVVLVGPAVRLTRFLHEREKQYRATIVFGTATDTDDAQGSVIESAPVPEALADPRHAAAVVSDLLGPRRQVPPAYSALKVSGRKAYDLARSGESPVLEARPVHVYDAALVRVLAEPHLAWEVTLTVSKGTYVRAVARDLGRAQGTAAHLSALRRERIGTLRVEDAYSLEDVDAAADPSTLFVSALAALDIAALEVDAETARAVRHGRSLEREARLEQGSLASLHSRGRLLAVYRAEGDRLVPEVVLPGGCP